MTREGLLTIQVTTTLPAPPEVLRERLAERLAECKLRAERYRQWAETVSGQWLLEDIKALEAALAAHPDNQPSKGKE